MLPPLPLPPPPPLTPLSWKHRPNCQRLYRLLVRIKGRDDEVGWQPDNIRGKIRPLLIEWDVRHPGGRGRGRGGCLLIEWDVRHPGGQGVGGGRLLVFRV